MTIADKIIEDIKQGKYVSRWVINLHRHALRRHKLYKKFEEIIETQIELTKESL